MGSCCMELKTVIHYLKFTGTMLERSVKQMKELNTDRLHLRYICEGDAQRIFDCWASKPEVAKYLTWLPHENVETTKQVIGFWLKDYEEDPNCMRWGIELKKTGELIGMIDVVGYRDGKPVIGYCSGPAYWGNGYMTEALHAVVEELFLQGHAEILIEAVQENIGSCRVIEKNGFAYTGSREEPISRFKPDEIVTVRFYALKK